MWRVAERLSNQKAASDTQLPLRFISYQLLLSACTVICSPTLIRVCGLHVCVCALGSVLRYNEQEAYLHSSCGLNINI